MFVGMYLVFISYVVHRNLVEFDGTLHPLVMIFIIALYAIVCVYYHHECIHRPTISNDFKFKDQKDITHACILHLDVKGNT